MWSKSARVRMFVGIWSGCPSTMTSPLPPIVYASRPESMDVREGEHRKWV